MGAKAVMDIDMIKQRIQNWRKEWIKCDVSELRKRNEKAKHISWTFIINGIFFAYFYYNSFSLESEVISICLLIITVYFFVLAVDSANDRNRINMWIYLKENK